MQTHLPKVNLGLNFSCKAYYILPYQCTKSIHINVKIGLKTILPSSIQSSAEPKLKSYEDKKILGF